MSKDDDKWRPGGHGGRGWEKLYPANHGCAKQIRKDKELNKMSQATNHPTKESALVVVDALNEADNLRDHPRDAWSYSVVQNAGGYWIVQIHDENDEFVGAL